MARVFRYLNEVGENVYSLTSISPPFDMSLMDLGRLAEYFAEACIRHSGVTCFDNVLHTLDTTPPPGGMLRGVVRVPCYALNSKEFQVLRGRFGAVYRTKALHHALRRTKDFLC